MTPNPELMHLYGTDLYFLEKNGSLPGVLSVLAPLASMGLAHHESQRAAQQQQEAEIMNYMFRQAEHQRLQQTIAGLKGASAREEYIKIAENVGRRLAHQTRDELAALMEKAASGAELTELEKEALIGAGLLAKGLGALGRGLGSAGKSLGWGATGTIGRGGLAQTIGTKMRTAGAGLRTKGLQLAGTKAAPAAAAGAAAPAAAAASKAKPLIGWGTKAKIGLGALGLGAGYAGYKGLQAAKDYMMQPTAASTWGHHTPGPPANVNQFGYPAY